MAPKPLKERITWFNDLNPTTLLPMRSKVAKWFSLGIYAIWAHFKDRSILNKILSEQKTAMNDCIDKISTDLDIILKDEQFGINLKNMSSSSVFKNLIINKIFDEVKKSPQTIAQMSESLFHLIPNEMRENKEFWVKALGQNYEIINKLPDELNNLEFWMNPVIWRCSKYNNSQLIDKLPDSIKNDPVFLKFFATIKLQKWARKIQISKKIRHIDPAKIETQKKQLYSVSINTRVRQPLEDITRDSDWIIGNSSQAQAQHKVTNAAKLGSYDKFELALKASFKDTLQNIYLSPPDQRKYVVIADDIGKSSNWVMAHLHDLMSVHPPSDIVSRKDLEKFLKDNPDIKHVVMVDDGTYSGDQASQYIGELKGLNKGHKFHVTIPYMTNFGKNKIITALQKQQCDYAMHNRQLMLSYEELDSIANIFSYTGRVTVDSEKLDEILPLPNEDNSPIKDQVNQKLLELRNMIKEKEDEEHIYKKTLEMLFFIDKSRDKLGKEGERLGRGLFQCLEAEQSELQHDKLIQAYAGIEGLSPSRTASWFSHKGADGVSTNYTEMLSIAGGKVPIEPYKEALDDLAVSRRKEQVDTLLKAMEDNTLEKTVIERGGHLWLKGKVDFVQTNRGFFLLGNSYLKETSEPPIIIYINGKKIILGGKEGEYQYKIKVGDEFELEDMQTQSKNKLKLLESGQLEIVNSAS